MLDRVRKARREEGFTLIELLIVIVILGILAAIVVFAVGTASTDSKKSACQADKKTLGVAMEAYKAKNGAYPASMSKTNNGALVTAFMRTWPGGADYDFTTSADTTTGAITVVAGTAGGPPSGC